MEVIIIQMVTDNIVVLRSRRTVCHTMQYYCNASIYIRDFLAGHTYFIFLECSIEVYLICCGLITFRSDPFVFGQEDTEAVLESTMVGTYLLYKDYNTDRIYLSVRSV